MKTVLFSRSKAKADVDKRRRRVLKNVVKASGQEGAKLADFNQALQAEGLPKLSDVRECDRIVYGVDADNPEFEKILRIQKEAVLELLRTTPGFHSKMTVGEAREIRGMSVEGLEAFVRKRLMERLGARHTAH